MVYLTCAVISLDRRGVIKTWTEMAARVHLYMLASDLTPLVPPQFSHWLQVGKVGTTYICIYFYVFLRFRLTQKARALGFQQISMHTHWRVIGNSEGRWRLGPK